MEKKEVFISYKAEEIEEANWVRTTLERNGISCWMAPMSITGGASYAEEIPGAIRKCDVFVLILSSKCQQSKWVPRELDQAINEGKTIMPFMIEKCPLSDEFSFYLSNVQRYEAYDDKYVAMEHLIRDIYKKFGKKLPDTIWTDNPESEVEPEIIPTSKPIPVPVKKADKQPKPQKKSAPPKIIGVICAVILLIVALVFVIGQANTIIIAGEKFHKNDTSVSLENVTLTKDDIQQFEKFKELRFVQIHNCEIEALILSSITTQPLYSLEISNCDLKDSQLRSLSLEKQEELSDLNISGNRTVTNLSTIPQIADRITHLNISNTSIDSFDELQSFTKLKSLSAENLGISDLGFMTNMIYLEEIDLSNNEISSLNGLNNTTIIKSADLCNNLLTDVSVLGQSAETLTIVYLNNNMITDLSCLKDCKNLTTVSVDNNLLSSLNWLTSCSQLTTLSAANNNIASVEGLGYGEELTYLDLSMNKLAKIETLGLSFKPGSYVTLNLSDNQITSIVSLPRDCSYSYLAINGNPLEDLAFLEYSSGPQGNNIFFDYLEGADYNDIANSGFGTFYMIDCPLNQKVAMEDIFSSSIHFSTTEETTEIMDTQIPYTLQH